MTGATCLGVKLYRFLFIVFVVLLVACSKKAPSADPAPLPVLTDQSTDVTLMWIDDKGAFHRETKISAIPEAARDAVRVDDPLKDPPKLDDIFVADVRQAGPDGHYPVKTMSRTDFEKIALDRRKGGSALADRPAASVLPGNAAPTVIIYGASWCGPCHQAADYLKSHNVNYVLKDIEEDHLAQREMQSKLEAAGMNGGSIPVIDVKGKLLIGFDARSIDHALAM